MTDPLVLLALLALGAVAGMSFAIVWRIIVPHAAHGRFWSGVGSSSRELLTVDEPAQLWAVYRKLLGGLGIYLARNMGGIVLGLLPMILILVFVADPLFGVAAKRAQEMVVVPANGSLTFEQPIDDSPGTLTGALIPDPQPLESLAARVGMCPGTFSCLTLETLGFEVVPLAPAESETTIIVRAARGEWSPFWPWIAGPEFVFYLSFFIVMTVALIIPIRRSKPS